MVKLLILLVPFLVVSASKTEKPTSIEDLSTTTLPLPEVRLEGRVIAGKSDKNYYEILSEEDEGVEDITPCTCGIFLSGQLKKGSKDQPKGVPVLMQETETPFISGAMGNKQCTNKCLELIVKHLPKSNDIICAAADRDNIFKERAYLFIKNRTNKWFKTNLSAGREFCCKDYEPYKCHMGI